MDKFTRPFWLLTFLFLFIVFILSYAFLESQVIIYINEESGNPSIIKKQNYFYWGLGLILITNIVLYLFSKLIRVTFKVDAYFLKTLSDWFISLAGILNIFLLLSIVFILLFNRMEGFDPSILGYLLYLCVFVMFVWMGRLVILLIKDRN